MPHALYVALLWSGCALPKEPLAESDGQVSTNRGNGAAGAQASPTDADAVGPEASSGATGDAGPTQDEDRDGGAAPDAGRTDAADAAPDASLDGGVEPPLDSSPVMPPPDPPDVFGLACDAVTCPALPAGSEQCCTGSADVEAKNARGVDRCGVLRPAAGGCVELEQGGVPDDRCPTLTPPGAPAPEPGCCTVDGLCGTLDAVQGIGCHVDGALHAQPCGDEDIEMGVSCEPTGVFAMRADIDVAWGGQSGGLYDITDDGRGKIRVWLRAAIDDIDADGELSGELRICGATLPAFYSSVLCESYLPVFPEAIWDSGLVPALPLSGRYQCQSPGCIVTIDSVTGLAGISLDDIDGPWPSPAEPLDVQCAAGDGLDCYHDHDDDGLPGVTVLLPSEGRAPAAGDCDEGFEYRGAPLNANPFAIIDGVRRSDRLQLGVRLRLGGSGRLGDDCASAAGSGVSDFVQSRAAGCLVEPGTRNPFGRPAGSNDPCSDREEAFMNDNLPIYDILALGEPPRASLELEDDSPGQGTALSLLRLADLGSDVSCAEVRAALE